MCEFCHKHGEGKKWYLQSRNYSEDLLSDLHRRRYIHDFFLHPEKLDEDVKKLEKINRLPSFIGAVLTPFMVNRQKKIHYGQVVPIEDLDRIFDFVNSVVRLPCICRQASVGSEQRYCYGISMAPLEQSQLGRLISSIDADYLNGPDTKGFEVLSKDEALFNFRELEKKGLCHTIWTFLTPFIGGICNCDRSDCMAMRATINIGFPVMFRAEYVAQVNRDLCNGCRQCMRGCQFGAIAYGIAQGKVVIDPRRCYGCGVCRSSCPNDAIVLNARSDIPAAAGLW